MFEDPAASSSFPVMIGSEWPFVQHILDAVKEAERGRAF